MKRIIIFLMVLAVTPWARAQVRGNNIVVTVVPNHRDWNYKSGETARFTINVCKSGTLLPDVKVDIEAGPVMFPDVHKSLTLKDGTAAWSGKLTKPGFYRVKATAHVEGKNYDGMCTAAFSPEQLKPYCVEPADFDAFWKRALDAARKNDLNPTRRLIPERCTKDVNVYEISYANNSSRSRIYGMLSVPVKEGKYPALLRLPGAGVRPYNADVGMAPGKCIVLQIGIHGIPVTMPQSVYDNLRYGALERYMEVNLEEPDKNYYKRVVTGAVRGVDYLASLPEWDGRTLGVSGASQGGFLSLAVAALDKRVTFLCVLHDAMCDYEAELHGVGGGWPHTVFKDVKNGLDKTILQKKVEGGRYYDGVNFARRVTQPGWYSFGYNDETVPPTSSYATYNVITAPKELSIYPMTGHFWYQEQWDEWQEYIRKHLLAE